MAKTIDIMRFNIKRILTGIVPAMAVMLTVTGCSEESIETGVRTDGTLILTARCGNMLPQYVDPSSADSRAGDLKDEDERRINTLHVFFFDSRADADGNHPLVMTTGIGFDAYQRIETNILAVPNLDKIFTEIGNRDIRVCALANLSGGTQFRTSFTPDGDMPGLHRDSPVDASPNVYEIKCYEDLQDWVYCPVLRSEEGRDIDQLPKAGMPMMGERVIKQSDYVSNKNVRIDLKALMARIDLNIKLDPSNESGTGLPRMTITEYGVMNMPTRVPYVARNGGAYNEKADTTNQPLEPVLTKKETRVLAKGDLVRFHYYTYENVRQPNWDAKRTNKTDAYNVDRTAIIYPEGVDTDEEKQRWKPTVARTWSASAIVLKADYITHQNLTYKAQFTIFIGENTVDDFTVRRNRQYVNNVSIRGLDYVRNSDDGVYTFDGRVNVKTGNPVYISVVNERKVDAHASVLPMDFFFLRPLNADGTVPNSSVKVSLKDPTTGVAPDWIRMEMITAAEMKSGVVSRDGSTDGYIQGMDGTEYSPGTGARKYFTQDLVTTTLRENDECTIYRRQPDAHTDGSRTRIYFYIDENIPATAPSGDENVPDRTATVYISYKNEETGETRERTIDINQRGLLRIKPSGVVNERTLDFFIEYYEEYMAHNDPLDLHSMPGELYSGLRWVNPGGNVSSNFATDDAYRTWLVNQGYLAWYNLGLGRHRSYNIYGEKDGYWMTDFMINGRSNARPIDLVKTYNRTEAEQPPTAFHYCYGKNKRNADGTVYTGDGKQGYWYLPGITELEKAMEKYYTTFPEFQEKWYWSASSAKDGIIIERELTSSARATQTGANGTHEGSGSGDEQPGRQPRTNFNRIRAAYIFNP